MRVPDFLEKQDLEEELTGLKGVLSVAQVVVSSLDLDEVLQNILCSAMAVMDLPAGCIALYDASLEQLSLGARVGPGTGDSLEGHWPVRDGELSRRILDGGEVFVLEAVCQASIAGDPLILKGYRGAFIAVPLKIQSKIVGILCLYHHFPQSFAPTRLEILSILASFAAMSIDNARLHQQTQQLALTDSLTGLYNQRQFQVLLRDEMARAKRYQKPMALLIFDVDDFKMFNDRHGHFKGDKALVAIAEILRGVVRECDMVFRYGGEEFIAILPETALDEAVLAAERARLAVETESALSLQGICGQGITVSVGVASFPDNGTEQNALLDLADALLYRAKSEGKNRICHEYPAVHSKGAQWLEKKSS